MAQTVEQYHIHDFSLRSGAQHGNPFAVEVAATFEHESGERVEGIPGFYDGEGEWKVRFSPTREGRWSGRTRSDDAALDGVELDEVQCVANGNAAVHGTLGIDPEHPQRFAWGDGEPFVILGFEWDWLFSYHQRDPERCYRHVDLIAERGFNYIVTNLYAHVGFTVRESDDARPVDPAYVFAPPDVYLFGGTNEEPDHSRMNVDFFRDFDGVMRYLHGKGVVVHLMIQVQNKQVRWPERRSEEDKRFWRYVVARYQAFGNLVWDVGKESKNLWRETGSHAYTVERIERIKGLDAYGHPVTVHDAEQDSAGTFSEADAAADFFSDQIHLRDAGRYNREAIRCLRTLRKPYLNIEYGYELGVDRLKTYRSTQTTAPWQDILKWTVAIYAAGAYPCYYYNNTSWDLIKFEPESPGWARYRYLKDFLDTLPFNRMEADNELVEDGFCLAKPGRAYLVYLPEGGDAVVDLTAVSDLEEAACEWMDIYSGERRGGGLEPGGRGARRFCTWVGNPFENRSRPVVLGIRVGE